MFRSAITCGLGIVLSLGAGGVARAAGGARPPKPIDIALQTASSEYHFGENITLRVTLTNRSDRTQDLMLASKAGQGRLDLLGLRYGDEPQVAPMTGFAGMVAGAVVLEPGRSLKLLYPWLFLPPGQHTLRARYSFEPTARNGTALDGLWRGTVESAPLTLRVLPPPLPADKRAALERCQSRIIRALPTMATPAKVKILRIMTHYVPQTRRVVLALLRDSDPAVPPATIRALGQVAGKRYCAGLGIKPDYSLIPDLIDIGKRATAGRVQQAVALAIGSAHAGVEGQQRDDAVMVLRKYVAAPDPHVAARAAVSLFKFDQQIAIQALEAKVERERGLDPRLERSLTEILTSETGEPDPLKAFRALQQRLGRTGGPTEGEPPR